MSPIARPLITSLVSASLILTTAVDARAADETSAVADEIAETVAAAIPEHGSIVGDAEIVAGEVQMELPAGDVIVPIDPEQSIVISAGAQEDAPLSVALPTEVEVEHATIADDGTIVYEAVDGGADVAVQVLDDASARIMTVIPDASASRKYTYDLAIPTDAVVTEGEDGSMLFTTPDGDWLGGVAAPWATDANGSPVPTRYRIEGSALVQEVDFTNTTAFPVVADPWLGKALFKSITRKSMGSWWKVSADKSAWGLVIHRPTPDGLAIMHTAGWNEIQSKYPHTVRLVTFRQQYQCHVAGGYGHIAGDWNLEGNRPARTIRGWVWGVERHRCNWETPDRY